MSPVQGQGDLSNLVKLREFLVVFLPFAALLAVALAAHYYSIYRTERVTIETREMLNVGLARSELNNLKAWFSNNFQAIKKPHRIPGEAFDV